MISEQGVGGLTFSRVLITLLRGVMFREAEEADWGALLSLQAPLQDHVA